jgi:hypothetical protein
MWESGVLDQDSFIEKRAPSLKSILEHLVESCHSNQIQAKKPKTFFSRYSEIPVARFVGRSMKN